MQEVAYNPDKTYTLEDIHQMFSTDKEGAELVPEFNKYLKEGKPKDCKTLLDWFDHMVRPDNDSFKRIVFALGVLEEYVCNEEDFLAGSYEGLNEYDYAAYEALSDYEAEYEEWITELCDALLDRAMTDDKLNYAIRLFISDSVIFTVAEEIFRDNIISEGEKKYNGADEKTKANIKILLNYIWNIRKNRFVTFLPVKNSVPYQLNLRKKIPKDELKDEKVYLKAWITSVVADGGSLIFRRSQGKETFVINGFLADKGNVVCMDVGNLEDCCCRMPDGTYRDPGNETYEVAPLLFRKA